MNLSEFKAWFEGFTEGMDGPPNAKQWKRIRSRVGEITPEPTPWPIMYQRYIEPIRPYWHGPIWAGGTVAHTSAQRAVKHNGLATDRDSAAERRPN